MRRPEPDSRSDSWAPRGRRSSERPHHATGNDVERALGAAEKLLAEGADESRHLQTLRFAAVSFLIVTLLSIGGLAIGFVRSQALALLGVAFGLGIPAAVLLLRLALRRTRSQSTELASEIAAMVGEVITDVAAREAWSQLRIDSCRLRLSAFPIVDRRPSHEPSPLSIADMAEQQRAEP